MNKRIIIKTTLICFGIFMILTAGVVWGLMGKYEFDRERRYQVIVAKVPIQPGSVLNEDMLGLKTIKESAYNSRMITDPAKAVGTKAAAFIGQEDYIRSYELLPREKWYDENERVIVLPMEVEERLANLIKKGSYIDIKLAPKDVKSIPKRVLSKIKVEDILDENGVSLGADGANKKAFARLVLDDDQRNKIYVAREMGKLMFELYCDITQNPPEEEFQIPEEYLGKPAERPKGQLSADKLPQKAN